MSEPIHIISLGAGVQSSAMALMAAKGEITPMPMAAIFADTGDEPESVYKWLDWLETQLPFPVIRVAHKSGRLSAYAIKPRITKDGRNYVRLNIPLFTKSVGLMGGTWSLGKTNRKCTPEFKIEPILKHLRLLKKRAKSSSVVQWIGISLDEMLRMKDSRHKWLKHRYPLVDGRKSRHDCLLWMARNGYPTPPRSACRYCAYHSDSEWARQKRDEPKEFALSCAFDEAIREAAKGDEIMRGEPFLHRSCIPLSEVDFSTEEQRGQIDMFNNECEGMCGV